MFVAHLKHLNSVLFCSVYMCKREGLEKRKCPFTLDLLCCLNDRIRSVSSLFLTLKAKRAADVPTHSVGPQ